MNKIDIIKEHKSDIIAGLNVLLDRLYDLKEYTNENSEIKEELQAEQRWKNYVLSMAQDTTKYEKLRRKMIDEDFNFTTMEIKEIGLVYFYLATTWSKQIEMLTEARDEANKLFKELTN